MKSLYPTITFINPIALVSLNTGQYNSHLVRQHVSTEIQTIRRNSRQHNFPEKRIGAFRAIRA